MNDRVETANKLYHAASNENEWNHRFNVESTESHNAMYELMRITGSFERSNYARFIWTFRELGDLIDPKCYLEYHEWIPSGGDECDLEWDWRCSNCNHDLMEHYEDLDVKTYEELGLLYCPHCGARILGTRYRKDDDSER